MELVIRDNDYESSITDVIIPTLKVSAAQKNAAVAYLFGLRSKGSATTIRGVLNNIARILSPEGEEWDLVAFPWHEITFLQADRLIQSLIEMGRAPSTINAHLSAIKGVALKAWNMDQITTDSYQKIKQVKGVTGTRVSKGRALSQHEVRALLSACDRDNTSKSLRDAAIVAVLVGCGLRRAEVAGIEMAAWDRENQSLNIMGKGNKERISFTPQWVADRLELWINEVRGEEPGPLFTRIRRHDDVTMDGITGHALYHILILRAEEAGIKKFAPHDLRRTYATKLLSSGEDLIVVKNAMGHSNISTTEHYDYRGLEKQKEASLRVIY